MRINTYIYPDGTKSIRKPRDGETFKVWDPVDQCEIAWQYDGYKEQWCRVIQFKEFCDNEIILQKDLIKCECGSEATGSNRHSTWCKKWTSDE